MSGIEPLFSDLQSKALPLYYTTKKVFVFKISTNYYPNMSHLHNNVSTIKNGYNARKSSVTLFSSKKSVQLLRHLQAHGFIKSWSQKNERELFVQLKYVQDVPAIQSFKIISKPSSQVRLSFLELTKIQNTSGIVILDTHIGFLSHHQALNYIVGGNIVCLLR